MPRTVLPCALLSGRVITLAFVAGLALLTITGCAISAVDYPGNRARISDRSDPQAGGGGGGGM